MKHSAVYKKGKRITGAVLTAVMLVTVFPFSAVAYAVEDDGPVTIKWEPGATENGSSATVNLYAELTGEQTSAEVQIKLSADEKAALDADALDTEIFELKEAQTEEVPDVPDVEQPSDGDSNEGDDNIINTGEGSTPGTGEGSTPGTGEGSTPGTGEGSTPGTGEGSTPNTGEGGGTKDDTTESTSATTSAVATLPVAAAYHEDDWILSFTLTNDNSPIEQVLTFMLPDGKTELTIDVDEDDITVLAGGNDITDSCDIQVPDEPFTLNSALDSEQDGEKTEEEQEKEREEILAEDKLEAIGEGLNITVPTITFGTTQEDALTVSKNGINDFSFTIDSIAVPGAEAGPYTYSAVLTLPEGVTLAGDNVTAEGAGIKAGETTVATFALTGDNAAAAQVALDNAAYTPDTRTLSFDIKVSAAAVEGSDEDEDRDDSVIEDEDEDDSSNLGGGSVPTADGNGNNGNANGNNGNGGSNNTTASISNEAQQVTVTETPAQVTEETKTLEDGTEDTKQENEASEDKAADPAQETKRTESNLLVRAWNSIVRTFKAGDESETVSGTLTFTGSAFTVNRNTLFAPGAGGADITLAVKTPNGDETTQSITLQSEPLESAYDVAAKTDKTQTVNWYDNNVTTRPRYGRGAGEFYPQLFFTITKEGEDTPEVVNEPLTWESLPKVGLIDWPEIEPDGDSFTINLPTKLTQSDPEYITRFDVTWTFERPEAPDGYLPSTSTDSAGETVWDYQLTKDVIFKLDLNCGSAEPSVEQIKALLGQFTLYQDPDGDAASTPVANWIDVCIIKPNGDGTYTITIPDQPAYAKQSPATPIEYYLQENQPAGEETADNLISAAELAELGENPADFGLEAGDSLAIVYDNTGLSNIVASNAVYDGGTLKLTRTGTTGYMAYKDWLDNGDADKRPDVTFDLRRYTEGNGYISAAPVYEANGALVSWSGNGSGESTSNTSLTVTAANEDGGIVALNNDETQDAANEVNHWTLSYNNVANPLPKYDQDGNKYIYVVMEYLTYGEGDNQYEQVFGKVGEDGETAPETFPDGADTTDDDKRTENDHYLYNNGTLSNRLTGQVQTTVTKVWEASAFQAALDDVAVELTAYQRVKVDEGINNNPWVETDETIVLHDFYAENMSIIRTVSMPKYDAKGQELEYEWRETAVYQGEAIADLPANASDATVKDALEASESRDLQDAENDRKTFTLEQSVGGGATQTVTYTSESVTKDNNTTVTNRIADTIDYALEKTWDRVAPQEVTFSIYQAVTGKGFNFDLPYLTLTFTYDKNGALTVTSDMTGTAHNNETIKVSQTQEDIAAFNDKNELENKDWDAIIKDLPKYDASGALYEYVLLENGENDAYFPTYTTERYNATGDYSTVVVNAPGEGDRIMVRKEWLDDSDAEHRQAVTLGVFAKEDIDIKKDDGTTVRYKKDEAITTTQNGEETPLTYTLENGVWWGFIYLPDGVDADDVYVKELSVGGAGHEVEYYKKENVNNQIIDDPIQSNNVTYVDLYDENVSVYGRVESTYHRYEVTYEEGKANSETLFTITNRRLGRVDLTATKKWVAGQGEDLQTSLEKLHEAINKKGNLALAVQLQFDGEPEGSKWIISNSGSADTVNVGGNEKVPIQDAAGNQVSSIQIILSGNDKLEAGEDGSYAKEFYFYNLPKYDSSGEVVHYQIEEVWVEKQDNGTWKPITENLQEKLGTDLWTLWKEYTHSITSSYEANVDDPDADAGTENHHDQDEQTVTVTNRRSGTKTVTWYKEWRDDFTNKSNQRPDIYLDIYAVRHVKDEEGAIVQQISQIYEDYRWSAESTSIDSDDGEHSITLMSNTESNDRWSVTLSGVQKYDDYGYEIMYYAVERTVVKASDYDYQAVQYIKGENGDIVGDRDGMLHGESVAGNPGFTEITLNLLNANYKSEADDPSDSIGKYNNTENGNATYPQYALKEGNTFVNTLGETYTINGVKLWENLPEGYNVETDLPTVTFNVYQFYEDTTPIVVGQNNGKKVATLTIDAEDWQYLGGGNSYAFEIDHLDNTTIDENGDYQYEDGADFLPLYDAENGKKYTYRVTETITLRDGVDASAVYDETSVPENQGANVTVTNKYDSDLGAIKVKKILSLPKDINATTGGFPEIKFTLKRSYTDADGKTVEDTKFSKSGSISKDVVENAFDDATKAQTSADPVIFEAGMFTFENLEIYAPNGSKYNYTVTEKPLGDYETYAVKDDVEVGDVDSTFKEPEQSEISGLEPEQTKDGKNPTDAELAELTVQATFYNVRKEKEEQTTVKLTGTKVWKDFENAMKTRPTGNWTGNDEYTATDTNPDPLNLTVTRTAKNGEKQELILGTQYKVIYTKVDDNKWTFIIDGTGTGELAKYASDGQAWTYTVTEELGDELGYTSSGTWTTAGKNEADGKIALGEVTNSIYTDVKFAKKWQDENERPITNGAYLDDFNVKVTFELQVKKEGDEYWQKASEFFEDGKFNVLEGYEFTKTLAGTITEGDWSSTFTNLPTVVKNPSGGGIEKLSYRVVETKVEYGETGNENSQTVTYTDESGYTVASNGLVTGAAYELDGDTHVTTNTIGATSLTVTKNWEDSDNAWGTRPDASGATMTWKAWFVVQRTTDETNWENVAVVNLFGRNTLTQGDKWEESLTGLPTADFAVSGDPYTYRVRELLPNPDGYSLESQDAIDAVNQAIVEPNGTYYEDGNFEYETTYEEDTGKVTNELITTIPEAESVSVTVTKEWKGTEPNADTEVQVKLQYKLDGSDWKDYESGGSKTLTAANGWKCTWDNLPVQHRGGSIQAYRVVEVSETGGYVQLPSEMDAGLGADETTFYYNFKLINAETTSFTVEKEWNPAAETPSDTTVKVGLYRTIDKTKVGQVIDGETELVPTDEMDNFAQQTAELSADSWTYTFDDLPKYNKNDDLYYYFAMELDEDGNPVADNGSIRFDDIGDFHVDYDNIDSTKTTITNTEATFLPGKKIWKDNGNAYGTRPENLVLNIYRNEGTEPLNLAAEGIEVKWDKPEDSDEWTYTISNLPLYDTEGRKYTYRVEEVVPAGYTEEYDGEGTTAGAVAPTFTNTLTGTVTINGTKTWEGATGTEPILTLERRLAGLEGTWTKVEVTEGQLTWNETLTEYTYTGLDKYNGEGKLYEYRVTETVPDDGYDVYYQDDGTATDDKPFGSNNATDVKNMAITNVERGALTVTKQVTGNRGDYDRQFEFEVAFTLPENYVVADNGLPTVTYTKTDQAGETTVETASFTEESDELTIEFTLADDESMTFTGLPGGTGYVVEETNSYYHSVSSTGETGTIPAGGITAAEFVNNRHSSGGGNPDPEEPPDEPETDIPDDPTPGEDIPPDEPDVPDEPDEPETDIPDDPTPGENVPPDEPNTPDTPSTPSTPSTPDTPSQPKLPQTGQLWWPVGLLLAAGLGMLLTGIRQWRKEHRQHGKKNP